MSYEAKSIYLESYRKNFLPSFEKYSVTVVEGSKQGLQNRELWEESRWGRCRDVWNSFIKVFVGPEGNKDENVKIFFFYCAVSIGLKKKILTTWHSLKWFIKISSSRLGENCGFRFAQKFHKANQLATNVSQQGQADAGKINFYLNK